MKRIFLTAVLSLLALLVCGCQADTPAVPETEAEIAETEKETVMLTLDSDYTIVRSDDKAAGDAEYALAIRLRDALRETVENPPTLSSDFAMRGKELPTDTPEILVGLTNRPESADLQSSLSGLSYAIRVKGNRVVICGSTDVMLTMAVEEFIAKFVTGANGSVQIPDDTDIFYETDMLRPVYEESHKGFTDGVLTVYPVPACYTLNDEITVTVNGKKVPLIEHTVDYDYCSFALSGKAEISVTVPADIKKCTVTPIAAGYETDVSGKTATFTMNEAAFLIVTVDDHKKVVIAADEPETDVPDPRGDGVYCIGLPEFGAADPTGAVSAQEILQKAIDAAHKAGGGTVYVPEGVYTFRQLFLKSNVSLYLAPGAVLRVTDSVSSLPHDYTRSPSAISPSGGMKGHFLLTTDEKQDHENIRIYGRGTIDGNGVAMLKQVRLNTLVHPVNVTNFHLEGIILRDGAHWSTMPTNCTDVVIEKTKHLNDISPVSSENDAIDIVCCQNVRVSGVLAFSEDDAISAKSYTASAFAGSEKWMHSVKSQDNRNILVENSTVWSVCGGLKIGWGAGMNTTDVTFRDCTVYRAMTGIDVSFRHGDALVSDILFENITVEGFSPRIVTGKTYNTQFFMIRALSESGGAVKNITLRNISVLGSWSTSNQVRGVSAKSCVDNVVFENITLRGKQVKDLSGLVKPGDFTTNVKLNKN